MSFQTGAELYTLGFGSRPENVEIPHIDLRIPSTTDILYPIGKRWINRATQTEYVLTAITTIGGITSASWTLLGTNSGALNTLTTDDSNVVTPVAGNINLIGASPLSTTGSGADATINLSGTVSVANGGTGAVTLTAHGVLLGEGTSAVVATTAGTNGEILIGSTGADPVFGHLTPAAGIIVTEGAGTLSVGVSTGGFTPSSVSGTSSALAVQNSYIANAAGATTFTLPATAAVGDQILISGGTANTAGWVIAQNAGQTIHKENLASTTGVTGTATSAAHACETVCLMCITANTDFVILYSNGTVTLA